MSQHIPVNAFCDLIDDFSNRTIVNSFNDSQQLLIIDLLKRSVDISFVEDNVYLYGMSSVDDDQTTDTTATAMRVWRQSIETPTALATPVRTTKRFQGIRDDRKCCIWEGWAFIPIQSHL
jgi:hypothetical protein